MSRPKRENPDSSIDTSLAMFVDRDPCWRCATRGDIGCRHRRARAPVPAVEMAEAIGRLRAFLPTRKGHE